MGIRTNQALPRDGLKRIAADTTTSVIFHFKTEKESPDDGPNSDV